jgi:hypothetical protein
MCVLQIIQVSFTVVWCVLVHAGGCGGFWYDLLSSGVFWRYLVGCGCFGWFWRLLVCSDVF